MNSATLDESIVTALQLHTQPPFLHRVADVVAEAVNRSLQEERPSPTPQAEQVVSEGYLRLGSVLSPTDCERIREHFRGRLCFDAHSVPFDEGERARVRRGKFGEATEGFHFGSYPLADILEAPALWELANRPDILSIAAAHLGCRPTLYSLNAWWSFQTGTTAPVTQNFHRDFDDFRFCTLFVYLTDVSNSANGPHRFIRQSHRFERIGELVTRAAPRLGPAASSLRPQSFYGNTISEENDRLYEAVFDGHIDTIHGPAGFAFLADTSALHMGVPPASSPRLMFWARYGLRANHTSVAPVPAPARIAARMADPRSAYINRCIIRAP